MIGLAAVLCARDRLTAIISLGIQGFSVALIFLLFGAPDLSFTQFMVETLSVVILALVMTRLRLSPTDPRPLRQRLGDGSIALACGLGFALLLMRATKGAVQCGADGFLQHLFENHCPRRQCRERHHRRFPGHRHPRRDRRRAITGLAIIALIRMRAGGERKLVAPDPDRVEVAE